MDRITGFPPAWDKNTKILILGSMPSVKSLEESHYYGHPQNTFWPILERICNMPENTPYDSRLKRMNACGIGLWDVVHSCVREGSSDSRIKQVTPNRLQLYKEHCNSLRCIAFNGKTAEKLFQRFFIPEDFDFIKFISLPSTSPANAMLSKEDKFRIWNDSLKPYIDETPVKKHI